MVKEHNLLNFILCFSPAPPAIITTTNCGVSVINTDSIDI